MKQTFVYKRVGDLDIRIDVHTPEDGNPRETGRPGIFWIHGGALVGGNRENIKQRQLWWYLANGYPLFSIDYRLAPETKLAAIIDDVRDAWDWVRSEGPGLAGIDPDRIAVIGGSAGGYLTLMTGFCLSTRPKALVSFYGYGDLIGPWYSEPDPFYCRQDAVSEGEARASVGTEPISTDAGFPRNRFRYYLWCRQNGLWPNEIAGWDPHVEPEKFDPYQPVKNVTSDWPPTMLLHGTNDTDVPYLQSAMMADVLGKTGITHEFITVPCGSHGFDGWCFARQENIDAFNQLLSFLKKHVG